MVDVCKKRLMKLGTTSWKWKRNVFNRLWHDYFSSFVNKVNVETLENMFEEMLGIKGMVYDQ